MDKKKLGQSYEKEHRLKSKDYRRIINPNEEMEMLDLEKAPVEQRKERLFLEWLISHKKDSDLFEGRKGRNRSLKMWSPSGRSIILQYDVLVVDEDAVSQISYQKDARSSPILFYNPEALDFQVLIAVLKEMYQALNIQHLTLEQFWETLVALVPLNCRNADHNVSRFMTDLKHRIVIT